jgi:acetyl-CoA/propionyl-CoA carboxylase biotin carboxyl carrier protein
LDYDDPPARGHSLEFRINGEDPGRSFLPAPGTVVRWRPPSGPGVRLDSGIEEGAAVGGAFDSLLAKLVVTGATREQALRRARRALAEFEIAGLPTVLPFHRAVVDDPAFAPAGPDVPFSVHTRWVETEFAGRQPTLAEDETDGSGLEPRERITVEVDGRRVEVTLPTGFGMPSTAMPPRAARGPSARRKAVPSGDTVTCPMQATVIKVAVLDGQEVKAGDLVAVLEAMKMEQPITAHRSGRIAGLAVEAGAQIARGAVLCAIVESGP